MPHLHLSLQHGHDLILKRMKRRHSRADAVALVERLRARRPEIAIGADLIAGFPTEDEAMHPANLSIVRELGIVHGHVFPYSPRPRTPAARMPQVDQATIRRRAAELRETVAEVREALASRADRQRRAGPGRSRRHRPCGELRPGRRAGRDPRAGSILTITPTALAEGLLADERAELARATVRRLPQDLRALVRRTSPASSAPAKLDQATLDEIEDALILSDLGPSAAARICDRLAEKRFGLAMTDRELKEAVAEEIAAILRPVAKPLEIVAFPRPQVILVIGVNGSGKTTTIAKLAHLFQEQDYGVLLAAGDTFRAAAIGQLAVWAERIGVPIVSGPEGGDPASIVFDAVKQATATGIDALIVDTAGRLQNKRELMDELAKIRRVLGRLNPEAPHDVVLVLDATNGQNALSQIEVFKEVAGRDRADHDQARRHRARRRAGRRGRAIRPADPRDRRRREDRRLAPVRSRPGRARDRGSGVMATRDQPRGRPRSRRPAGSTCWSTTARCWCSSSSTGSTRRTDKNDAFGDDLRGASTAPRRSSSPRSPRWSSRSASSGASRRCCGCRRG